MKDSNRYAQVIVVAGLMGGKSLPELKYSLDQLTSNPYLMTNNETNAPPTFED
jgi:NADH:ubiquinone oxidoreductase subunit B-like Fe-S oxidoreductase